MLFPLNHAVHNSNFPFRAQLKIVVLTTLKAKMQYSLFKERQETSTTEYSLTNKLGFADFMPTLVNDDNKRGLLL